MILLQGSCSEIFIHEITPVSRPDDCSLPRQNLSTLTVVSLRLSSLGVVTHCLVNCIVCRIKKDLLFELGIPGSGYPQSFGLMSISSTCGPLNKFQASERCDEFRTTTTVKCTPRTLPRRQNLTLPYTRRVLVLRTSDKKILLRIYCIYLFPAFNYLCLIFC